MSQTDDELRDKIRKLYGYKKAHYINFEPRLEQLMQLFATEHATQSVALLEQLRRNQKHYYTHINGMDGHYQSEMAVPLAAIDAELDRLKETKA